jgi:hypothetical protein
VLATDQIKVITTDGDRDGDGLPDNWEITYGFDADKSNANEDPDVDGSSNLTEYQAGTDPLDPKSVFRIKDVEMDGTLFTFEVKGKRGKKYTVYSRSTLNKNSSWSATLSAGPLEEDSDLEFEIPMSGTTRFFRLGVQ